MLPAPSRCRPRVFASKRQPRLNDSIKAGDVAAQPPHVDLRNMRALAESFKSVLDAVPPGDFAAFLVGDVALFPVSSMLLRNHVALAARAHRSGPGRKVRQPAAQWPRVCCVMTGHRRSIQRNACTIATVKDLDRYFIRCSDCCPPEFALRRRSHLSFQRRNYLFLQFGAHAPGKRVAFMSRQAIGGRRSLNTADASMTSLLTCWSISSSAATCGWQRTRHASGERSSWLAINARRNAPYKATALGLAKSYAACGQSGQPP